jgi:hypothetical protein
MARPSIEPHNLRRPEGAEGAMEISVLGIDLGKNSCSVWMKQDGLSSVAG